MVFEYRDFGLVLGLVEDNIVKDKDIEVRDEDEGEVNKREEESSRDDGIDREKSESEVVVFEKLDTDELKYINNMGEIFVDRECERPKQERRQNYSTTKLDSRAFTTCIVEEKQVNGLVDTGAACSCISVGLWRELGSPLVTTSVINYKGVNGSKLSCKGKVKLNFKIGNMSTKYPFLVMESLPCDVLMGVDLLRDLDAVIDLKKNQIMFPEPEVAPIQSVNEDSIHASAVRLKSRVRIPSGGQVLVTGKVRDQCVDGSTGYVEQAGSPDDFRVANTLCTVNQNLVLVEIINLSDKEVVIERDKVIANISVIPENYLNFLSEDGATKTKNYKDDDRGRVSLKSNRIKVSTEEAHYLNVVSTEKILGELAINFKDTKLNLIQQEALRNELLAFKDIFVDTSKQPGRTDMLEFEIDTEAASPIKQHPYKVTKAEEEIMSAEIKQYLDLGLIRESTSPWSSPVLMIRKPDGNIRFCIDYRKLNSVTKKDSYPMPRIDDLLSSLQGSKLFSTMDIASGYWNVPMAERSIEKTAFTCKFGLYEWTVMPFGLCNAVPAFERLMETVLVDLKWRICLVYLDDCVIFSKTFPEHLRRIRLVLSRFRKAGFKLKMSKCHWGKTSITFLGHMVTSQGILPNPSKVKSVMTAKRPVDLTSLRAFLGLTGYFRRFIKGYATITSPLEKLKLKDAKFEWTQECEDAIEELKIKLCSPPVLAYPLFDKPFIIYTDASKLAVGAILMQRQEGKERVIAYVSKSLDNGQRKLVTKDNGISELESWAVVFAVRKFRAYIDRRKFELYTDHKALTWLFNKGSQSGNGKLARWALELQSYDYEVKYRPGANIGHADGLSRLICNLELDTDGSMDKVLPLDKLKEAQRKVPWMLEYILFLKEGVSSSSRVNMARFKEVIRKYKLDPNDVLLKEIKVTGKLRNLDNRKWVPVIPDECVADVLDMYHCGLLGSHLRFKRTYVRVRSCCYWPQMKTDIFDYCDKCPDCNRGKPKRDFRQGLRQRMPVYLLIGPFDFLVVDALGPLPETAEGNKFIIIFVDYFTKWVEAFPVPDLKTSTFLKVFIDGVITRHGVCSRLLSDRGTNFVSKLAKGMYEVMGIHKLTSTADHPQTQGLVERFNYTLICMLKMYVNDANTDWDKFLCRVLFAYRTSYQESLKDTPFFCLYGRDPTLPLDLVYLNTDRRWQSSEVGIYKRYLADTFKNTRTRVRESLIAAQNKICRGNGARDDVNFEVGDRVWVFNRYPGKRHEKDTRVEKFYFYWHGPFLIVDRISENVYLVEVSTSPLKTNSINVDRLRKYRGHWTRPSNEDEPVVLDLDNDVMEMDESELPKTSVVEKVSNGPDTAFTNADRAVLEILKKRKNKASHGCHAIEYLVKCADGSEVWYPRAKLVYYHAMLDRFENKLRTDEGLPVMRRSRRST